MNTQIPVPESDPSVKTNTKMSTREIVLISVLSLLVLIVIAFILVRIFIIQQNPDNKNITLFPEKISEEKSVKNNPVFDDALTNELKNQDYLKKFESPEALKNFLEKLPEDSYEKRYLSRETMSAGSFFDKVSPRLTAEFGDGMGGSDPSTYYSTTNIQVAGVDEPDIIKTDGKYIYAVSRSKKTLFIVETNKEGKMTLTSKIELESDPQNIFIAKDRLVIFGHDQTFYEQPVYRSFIRGGVYGFASVYDITERSLPRQIRQIRFEGNYFDARLIGNQVFFIFNTYGYNYFEDEPVVPRILDGDHLIENHDSKDVFYLDVPYQNFNVTTVASFDMEAGNSDINHQRYFLNGTENIYMSEENLYIVSTKYLDQQLVEMSAYKEFVYPRLPELDKNRIQEIESVPVYILNYHEKIDRIMRIYQRYLYLLSNEENNEITKRISNFVMDFYTRNHDEIEKTVIHKIALNKGALEYKTSGYVPGYIINQFSMDESNGIFRIATTRRQNIIPYFGFEDIAMRAPEEPYNNLYTLDANLKPLGKIEGIAKGERIYSTRFMGSRAYMVTFKEMDPFFTIDLSKPENPILMGELKLPGFSNYLHPYTDSLIMGFGHETTTNEYGSVTEEGLKLSLFDVSDIKNPKEVQSLKLGGRGSNSLALSDHKAFLFSKEKNLLSIPVTLHKVTPTGIWGDMYFQGIMLFEVNNNGFTPIGRIEHKKNTAIKNKKISDFFAPSIPYYDPAIQRSLFIANHVYTFSEQALQSNELNKNLIYKDYIELLSKIDYPEKPIYPMPVPLTNSPTILVQ